MDEPRRDHWEHATEWPLTAAALLFLGAYAWPILDPDLDPDWVGVCEVVTWVTWALFVLDYGARWWLSNMRAAFVKAHPFDLAAVVLPILRPLRVLRLVTVLTTINRRAATSLRGRVAIYVVGTTALVLFIASVAMLNQERGQEGSNINRYGDSLWWTFTTITTVGYGDHFPVTATGRFVAVALMVAGIALIGVVTASFASWLLQAVEEEAEESRAVTRRDIAELADQVAELRAELAAQRPEPPTTQRQV